MSVAFSISGIDVGTAVVDIATEGPSARWLASPQQRTSSLRTRHVRRPPA